MKGRQKMYDYASRVGLLKSLCRNIHREVARGEKFVLFSAMSEAMAVASRGRFTPALEKCELRRVFPAFPSFGSRKQGAWLQIGRALNSG